LLKAAASMQYGLFAVHINPKRRSRHRLNTGTRKSNP
jgi:hypothetical protein